MLKKCIVIAAIIGLCTNSYAALPLPGLMNNNPGLNNFTDSSPLKALLMINAEFDATHNLIVTILADLPDCEECPKAKTSINRLNKAFARLEEISKKLEYSTPQPGALSLYERSIAGIIYEDIIAKTEVLYWKLEDIGKYGTAPELVPHLIIGLVIVGAVIDRGGYSNDATCMPYTDEEDCRAAGCAWCDDTLNGSCEVSADPNESPCPFITEVYDCWTTGCTWHFDDGSGNCAGGYCGELAPETCSSLSNYYYCMELDVVGCTWHPVSDGWCRGTERGCAVVPPP
ncbi:MAG: hypothetical protein ABFS05_14195 [Bacteroidota bacterium]